MNYYIQDFCCVCLSISNEKCSNKSSTNVDNLTPLDKITTVFSELSSVMESDDRICTKCSDTVGFIYEFHKTCLKNINIFSSYKRILKENQPKKQCGLLVDLNESKKFKENTISKEIKIEPPESLLNNDYKFLDADLVSVSHLSGATVLNYETDHGESEKSQLDSENEINYEQTDLKNEWMNERSDLESLKSDSKDFENISVQSTDEMDIGKEENQELIEDPLRGVAEEKSDEGQGHSESFKQNQFESFEEKSIHVEQKIDSDNLPIHSERKKPFECEICGKLFEHVYCQNTHKLIHTGEKPHKCDICRKSFNVKGQLKRHYLIHTGEKPHECDICRKSFTQKGDLKKHYLIHTGERSHKCDFCGQSFKRLENLTAHKLLHTGEKPYKCDICGHLFRHKGNLNTHKLKHLKESKQVEGKTLSSAEIKIESPELPSNNEDIFLNADFDSESHLSGAADVKEEIDINYETWDGELETSRLDSEFKTENDQIDMKKELMNETDEPLDVESLKSNTEDFENISVQSTEEIVIGKDENQELIEYPFREVAEEKLDEGQGHSESFRQNHFESLEEKSIHVEQKIDSDSHMHMKKPFECDICGKLFEQVYLSNRHKRIHTGEKPYKCDICGKLFTLKGNLIKHKLIHTGEKPFKCDICGQLLTQMHSLRRHKLTKHTDAKP